MKTKPVSKVSKRPTADEKLQAKLWREFLVASSIPWSELSEEWQLFFYEQGDIINASSRLEDLAKKAVGEVV